MCLSYCERITRTRYLVNTALMHLWHTETYILPSSWAVVTKVNDRAKDLWPAGTKDRGPHRGSYQNHHMHELYLKVTSKCRGNGRSNITVYSSSYKEYPEETF
jgi:hypothetical protein